jgi:hypothetical protein
LPGKGLKIKLLRYFACDLIENMKKIKCTTPVAPPVELLPESISDSLWREILGKKKATDPERPITKIKT